MNILVVECVLDVAVQVTNVRAGFNGKLLVNVLGTDKFATFLPFKKMYIYNTLVFDVETTETLLKLEGGVAY